MQSITLCMRTWHEVRYFASRKFLTSHHARMHRVIFYT